jgi:hypothetical protein
MKADLDAAFKSAAADALRANTESFLALAGQQLGGQTKEARQTLEAKELAIKNLIDPLDKALKSLDEQTRAMEKERSGAYGEVKTLVEAMQKTIPASLDAGLSMACAEASGIHRRIPGHRRAVVIGDLGQPGTR